MPFVSLPRGKSAAASIWQGQEALRDSTQTEEARSCPRSLLSPFIIPHLLWYSFFSFLIHVVSSSSPPSLSHSFGKNSSWIVFLEEETNVRVTRLVQVLAKFDKNKVRLKRPADLPSVVIELGTLFMLSWSSHHCQLGSSSSPSWTCLLSDLSQCGRSNAKVCPPTREIIFLVNRSAGVGL